MMRLTKEREARGWTRRELGARSDLHPARVGAIELRRVVPYPIELGRLAAALGFVGQAERLLDEVASEPVPVA